jgi:hypothetical protein
MIRIKINKALFKEESQIQQALLLQTTLLERLEYKMRFDGDWTVFEGKNPIKVTDIQVYSQVPGMLIESNQYGFIADKTTEVTYREIWQT